MSESLGEAEALKLLDHSDAATALRNQDIAHAAMGGMLTGVASKLAELPTIKEVVPHRTFEAAALEGSKVATKLALGRKREQLKQMDELLSRLQSAGELR